MPSEAVIDVACLVLLDDSDRLFVARRAPGKSLGGLWEFPGGKVDPGESIESALRRELIEELEMDVGALSPLPAVVHEYDFGIIRLWPLMARCGKGESPQYHLHEHTDARWVDADAAAELDWAPADLPVLRELDFLSRA